MAKKYNKSDYPLKSVKDLADEVVWSDYEFKDSFSYACSVMPNADEEKLEITEQNAPLLEKSCVYVVIISGRIFKIGAALRGVKGRIGSYNSGRTRYRTSGTNSTTNYWCLQSFIKIGLPVKFHVYCPDTQTAEIFGEKIQEPFPSAKAIEAVIIRKFEEKYGKKPIGCTQG